MKSKGIRIGFCAILSFVLLYFFTCSVVGEYFIYHGRTRKIIYLLLIFFVSLIVTILLDRNTSVFEKMAHFSGKEFCNRNKVRFHIQKTDAILLSAIVLVGAILRFSGVNWGLTSIFQPDEGKLVKPALQMAIDLWPYDGNMGYPNQLVAKIAAVCFVIYSKITGVELSVNLIDGYFIFRTITAVFSTCTIIAAFLIGNYLKKHMGLILAAFVATFPEFVGLSKQVTADTIALFFMSLVLLMSLIYLENAETVPLVFMALFAAMATMEKWHSAVACFYIVVVVTISCKKIRLFFVHGFIAFVTYVLGMCIIAPNGFWHLNGTIKGLTGMYEYDKDGVATLAELLQVYIGRLFQYVGVIFVILLIAGIVAVWRERERKYIVLLLGVLKFVAICFLNRGFSRWGLEFYFTVLLLASMGAYALLTDPKRIIRYAGSVAFILVLTCLGCGSVLTMTTAIRSGQDTRLLQDEYCRINQITEENSAYEYYTGFEPGGINCKREARETYRKIEDSFLIENGKLYKKSGDILYAIDNRERYEADINELLQQECPVERSFETAGSDIFSGAVNGLEADWFEWGVIAKNIMQIKRIMTGDSMGPRIVIYDVSKIPVKEGI